MMEARTVDIFDYLQPVYQSKQELQQSSEIENFFLNALWQNVADIYNNKFIVTAGEYGISRRERYLNISPPIGATLEDRRFNLMVRYQEQAPYTKSTLERMLKTILGEGNFFTEYDRDTNNLQLNMALTSAFMTQTVEELLERVLPANMSFNTQIMYNTHAQLENYTHAQLENYTHKQLREGVL